MCWTYMWCLEASDSIQSAWCANWVCFHVPGVEYQRGRFHAALCVCDGVEVQRRSALDVFVIRGEARGLWVALGMDWLFRCRGSGGQRRELDSSNDAISPSVTGLALIRVSQDAIWVHHESLNWRRPFTRPQWQILLHITVLELRWL